MYEKITGNFGEVTYFGLTREYRLEYGVEAWFCPETNKYSHFPNQGWKSKKFLSLDDLKSFCNKEGISIVNKMHYVHHPLEQGLPDCRAISDYMYKYL
jgi:hypothetical protein